MEFEDEFINKTKSNLFTFNNDSNYQSKINDNINLLFNRNMTTNGKTINNSYPSCRIISSLFTKDFRETFCDSNDKIKKQIITTDKKEEINNHNTNKIIKLNPTINTYLINYNIYNIKANSIFHIKIFGKYIKYYPIFNELTEYEKYIKYNPLIENNQNFEIITNDELHYEFTLRNNEIPLNKLEYLKEKYIKHHFTKRNITYFEEIFKYLFEEIKINISCIDVESQCEKILKNCSILINDINEIVEEIINSDNKIMNDKGKLKISKSSYINLINDNDNDSDCDIINNFRNNKEKEQFCTFNNLLIKKKFILNCMNSKTMEYNFLEKDQKKEKDENTSRKLLKMNI